MSESTCCLSYNPRFLINKWFKIHLKKIGFRVIHIILNRMSKSAYFISQGAEDELDIWSSPPMRFSHRSDGLAYLGIVGIEVKDNIILVRANGKWNNSSLETSSLLIPTRTTSCSFITHIGADFHVRSIHMYFTDPDNYFWLGRLQSR